MIAASFGPLTPAALIAPAGSASTAAGESAAAKSFRKRPWIAVAAAAREHPSVLFVGLVLSVTFMGVAASFVARLIHRFPLLAWAGLLMILYVALKMIWEGWHDVAPLLG